MLAIVEGAKKRLAIGSQARRSAAITSYHILRRRCQSWNGRSPVCAKR